MRFATRVMMLVVAVSLFTLTPFVLGQAVYGSMYGTVTDATGAAVPGANITVMDVAKGTSVNVQSDGSELLFIVHRRVACDREGDDDPSAPPAEDREREIAIALRWLASPSPLWRWLQ